MANANQRDDPGQLTEGFEQADRSTLPKWSIGQIIRLTRMPVT